MPDQITKLLDQIDRLDQQAAHGPWQEHNSYEGDYGWQTAIINVWHNGDTPDMNLIAHAYDNNAEFIALARTSLPAMSKALRAVIEGCEETIRSVDKNLLPDERDRAFRDHAEMILDQITDQENNDE